jgi:hypothetical protein
VHRRLDNFGLEVYFEGNSTLERPRRVSVSKSGFTGVGPAVDESGTQKAEVVRPCLRAKGLTHNPNMLYERKFAADQANKRLKYVDKRTFI